MPNFSFYSAPQQQFIPVPQSEKPTWCLFWQIPLIVKQSLDLDGKKLIVIPEASHFSLYILAAADIRLLFFLQKSRISPEDSYAFTCLNKTTQTLL